MDRKTAERLLKNGKKGIQSWNKKKLSGVELPFLCGINLSGVSLCEANLSGLNLTGVHLQGADLSGADLSGSNLFEADLSEADLMNANLSGASLTWTNLSGANLIKADISEAELFETDLSWANLSSANLADTNLSGSDLTKANLSSANLSEATLTRANLTRAILIRANLTRANLQDTDLDQANLTASKLQKANLQGANLAAAVLVESKLDNANLSHCTLYDADINDWSINDVVCDGIIWDHSGAETVYKPGEFENQYGANRSIRLQYAKRMSEFEITTLPIMLFGIAQKEDCELFINAIEQLTDSSVVRISIGANGKMENVIDEIQGIPTTQALMDRQKIMPLLREWILDEAKNHPAAKARLQVNELQADIDWDTELAKAEKKSAKKPAAVRKVISKEFQHIKRLYQEIFELHLQEGSTVDEKAKATLLEQLRFLSEQKIKSLDQASVQVLKTLLSNLTASSVSIACSVLHFGFSDKH